RRLQLLQRVLGAAQHQAAVAGSAFGPVGFGRVSVGGVVFTQTDDVVRRIFAVTDVPALSFGTPHLGAQRELIVERHVHLDIGADIAVGAVGVRYAGPALA